MSIYDTLNPEQLKAVHHYEGPLLILAGAGSGKTRVLTHRAAWLVEEKGVDPWNILAITFTNKAAGEMRERIDKILNRKEREGNTPGSDVWVSTFHSMCVRILRRYIDRIGYGNSFTIYDTDDQKSLIRDILKRMNVDTKRYRERYFMSAISAAKDEVISAERYAKDPETQSDYMRKMTADVYLEYEKRMRANNALDFDDLICKTIELFSRCPDVLDSYQERFRFIMVDEYQDTNNAQFKLISQLAAKYRNLAVVGDDDQSIYRFRGANIGNILDFEKVFPDAEVIRLEQNYRSTQNILNAANEVIRKNTGRKKKTLWTRNGTGVKIHFRQFENAYEEAEFVSGEIAGKVAGGEASYGDFAILYRTNAQSRLFEERFLLANISYKIVGGVNFYSRKEIKDILAYLKTIENARDDLSVKRIINVPHRGIGSTTISRVEEFALEKQISFYEALRRASEIPGIGRGLSKLEEFVRLIETLRGKAKEESVRELTEDLIVMTGYENEIRMEEGEEAEDRLANIDELLNKASSYMESAEEPSLSGFLEEVALVADIDEVADGTDQVLLMTIHSAKGLEFPVVFMVGMEDGVFPGYMSISSDDPMELEEERRLCYVGITRAQKELYLSAARQRMVHGEMHYNQPSRFVSDISEDLLDEGTKPSSRQKKREGEEQRAKNASRPAFRQASEAFHSKAFASQKFPVKNAEGLNYQVGDRVSHQKFGEGTVTEITEGGRDYEVTVDFDRVGTKKMFASFAKLEKII